ncbi:3'(2'),5'-bisphosphate nucleotidase CysQ [Rhizobium straminoryzae]|uniref:3'(2'),5'-bisphosphate nucleotidase CysQ n=1 Tax=Rhizobium straminoryzae TaxID=1387186 RepID=A0A549TH00_9HYPH|nr:3'(2'),5'-bisphosphate nucleotidase CysQ [Rhizobium straminoryzae]TRL42116.1 3'(2'),5'-bisphosphate nucleotidase CysQ [Rhizobium straminoryzae]
MLTIFEEAAHAAGRVILEVYARGCAVETKPDATPVTEADIRAEDTILALLSRDLPDIPVVAEEQVAAGRVPDVSGGRFLLIDPLDGTREFISRNGEFTVNIALVENGVPVAGVVHAPALGLTYLGDATGAYKLTQDDALRPLMRQPITVRPVATPPVALASRSHQDPETAACLQQLGVAECRNIGSSLKFGLLAEGLADVYPRFGRTMEWDTAAGDAVLRAAGGMTLEIDGTPLAYGKRQRPDMADFANPAFMAWGRRES